MPPIFQIPLLYPPTRVQGMLVMAQLNIHGLILGKPKWYLTPPYPKMALKYVAHYEFVLVIPTIPCGPYIEPMTKPPFDVTKPTNGGISQPKLRAPIICKYLPEPSLMVINTKVRGTPQPKLKAPIMDDTPIVRVTPPCALYRKQGHATNLCPTFLELRSLLNTPIIVTHTA